MRLPVINLEGKGTELTFLLSSISVAYAQQLQAVHQGDRHLVRRLHLRRDAQRTSSLPRSRLFVLVLFLFPMPPPLLTVSPYSLSLSTRRPPPAHPHPFRYRYSHARRVQPHHLPPFPRLPPRAAVPEAQSLQRTLPQRVAPRNRLPRQDVDVRPGQEDHGRGGVGSSCVFTSSFFPFFLPSLVGRD